jgi:hypothetical protein
MIFQKIFYSIQYEWLQKSKQLQIINKSWFISIGHSAGMGKVLNTEYEQNQFNSSGASKAHIHRPTDKWHSKNKFSYSWNLQTCKSIKISRSTASRRRKQ